MQLHFQNFHQATGIYLVGISTISDVDLFLCRLLAYMLIIISVASTVVYEYCYLHGEDNHSNSLAELITLCVLTSVLLHPKLVLTTVLVNSSINVMLSPAVAHLHHVTLYLRWLLVQSNIEPCSIRYTDSYPALFCGKETIDGGSLAVGT